MLSKYLCRVKRVINTECPANEYDTWNFLSQYGKPEPPLQGEDITLGADCSFCQDKY